MTSHVFTGSSVERVLACPPSNALPHVLSTGEPAERGDAIHRFLCDARTLGREAALERAVEPWLAACEAIDVASLPTLDAGGYAAEVAYSYDIELGTARELGRNIQRAYGDLGPDEVPVTVDTVGLGADGESVFVGDYKTGRGRVTPAGRNAQLLLGALAACRAYGRSRAEVAIVYVREDEDPVFSRATLDEWALDGFAASLRVTADKVREARHVVAAGGTPTVSTGPQCRYCPAFVQCPAQTSLALAITSAPDEWRADLTSALTPERARAAYELYRRAGEVVKRAGEALHAYAIESGGIDIGDGMVYGPVTTKREYVDGAVTRQVLTEMHGPVIAERACSWSSSKTAIREALKHVAAQTGGKLAPLERDALAEIGKRRGIDRRESTACKEFVAKRKALP